MSEQKHTPAESAHRELINLFFAMSPEQKIEYMKSVFAHKAELLQQVAELTKENEEMMQAITKQDVIHGNDVAELSKLHKEFTELAIKFEDKNFELSRLREREKELVEALREFCQAVRKSDEKYPDWVGTTEVYGALFKSESLLSKFEANV